MFLILRRLIVWYNWTVKLILPLLLLICTPFAGIANGGTEAAEAPLGRQPSVDVLAVEATNTTTLASDGKQLERDFVAEFYKLVATNRHGGPADIATCNLCADIAKKFDKQESLRLVHQLMDVALAQPLVEPWLKKTFYRSVFKDNPKSIEDTREYRNRPMYNRREMHLDRLWDITFAAATWAQSLSDDPYHEFDRIIAFYGKWADEISATERNIASKPPEGLIQWKSSNEEHLHILKLSLKAAIDDVKFRFFREDRLSDADNRLSMEERTEILQRIAELEKLTVIPPRDTTRKLVRWDE